MYRKGYLKMQMIEVSKLKSHPRNNDFFEDITGDKWEDFKKSIIRRGVVESIVVTQDLIIVSGHQRVRACKEIGILEIPCRITHYPDVDERLHICKEDMILEDLICTNIMQRGIGNVNPMKMAKCILELERIYGINHGGNRSSLNNSNLKSQKELASDIGLDQTQLINYKKLLTLIPELQSLIEDGELSPTIGYKVLSKLSKEEQEQLILEFGKEYISKLTQKKAEELVKNKTESENKELQEKIQQAKQLQQKINVLEEETSKKLQNSNNDYKRLNEDYQKKISELNKLKEELNSLKSVTEEQKYIKKMKDSTIFFCARVDDFIEKTGGFVWLSEHINELPEYEKNSYIKAIEMVENWAFAMKANMKNYI